MGRKLFVWFLVAGLADCVLVGCAGEGPSALQMAPENSETGPPATIDFATQIQPIFDSNCSCHLSPAAPQGAVLLAGASYESLVNKPSTENLSLLLVKPGSPDESYLVIKVDDSVEGISSLRVGDRMPPSRPPLGEAEIRTLRQWILEGAPRVGVVPEGEQTDTEPPRFDGATLAVANTSSEISLSWDRAVDNETPQADINYNVFWARESGAQDFAQPSEVAPAGSSGLRVANLEPSTLYHFVVRSADAAGNQDSNRVEVSATTLAPDATEARFARGDVDNDGSIRLSDAVHLLEFLFKGGFPPVCRAVADVDADGSAAIGDAIFLLNYLFLGGDAPLSLSENELSECDETDAAAIARGIDVYSQPDTDGNLFACATCHASVPDAQSDLLYAGHSLSDALRRPSFKLGELDRFLDATNICRVHWMQTTPWNETAPSFTDLVAFLETISPTDPAPPLAYEIVRQTARGPPAGDALAGCELFHGSCVVCHGPGATGTELAPSLVRFPINTDFVRAKVRLSGPSDTIYEGLIGGRMPFWAQDKLSDEEIEDLVTFLATRPVPQCTAGGDEE